MSRIGWKTVVRSGVVIAAWVPVYITVTDSIVHIARVDGASMQPALNPGLTSDWVLLWKWGVRRSMNLQRDDVVLFRSPMDPSKIYCKRIKGTQYDTIATRPPYPKAEAHIPRNHIWVEGDNITRSIDSNKFGPISTGLVLGKAVCIIWPPSRWHSDLKVTSGRDCILTARGP
ncbi:Mitochondrial inner membrane protease subunit 2 [Nakaseomyces bracarensis]|uniref:Mitochondrial inner membrane protease subunit 2 n=1 Tax=Nakaseomyces bracarensis TaxID=273131 RepID=A0ABR4NVN1_9SACH